MRLENHTTHRISKKWLQKILNHLGVNPLIEVCYADNPAITKVPNYIQAVVGTRNQTVELEGIATDENRVFLFVGRWESGEFIRYTENYVKWILLHELRHQYYYYHLGNTNDPWGGLSITERVRREERACNRFANHIIGKPDKDFPKLRLNGKRKRKSARKS